MSMVIGAEILIRYIEMIKGGKTLESNVFVLNFSNNARWFSSSDPLKHATSLGKVALEIRWRNDRQKFAFYVISKALHESPCFRFDSAGISHKNNYLDVPLKQREVPTPHFAKFDDSGRWIAYRTDRLENEPNLADDIKLSLMHFFEESVINLNEAGELEIVCTEFQPEFNILEEKDPHTGVTFP